MLPYQASRRTLVGTEEKRVVETGVLTKCNAMDAGRFFDVVCCHVVPIYLVVIWVGVVEATTTSRWQ